MLDRTGHSLATTTRIWVGAPTPTVSATGGHAGSASFRGIDDPGDRVNVGDVAADRHDAELGLIT